jgi:hypothetical protein
VNRGFLQPYHYRRTLTAAEQRALDTEIAAEQAEELAEQCARRDLYFGFAGDAPEEDDPQGV